MRASTTILAAFLCLNMAALPSYAASAIPGQSSISSDTAFEAMQAAEILGVKTELQRFRNLQGGAAEAYENESLAFKSLLLRKILLGFVQVRQASNKIDIELS